MENVKLIKAAKPVMTNNARQHVSKHFDIVLAIDFHWTTIPLPPSFGFIPLPLPHPFIGMVFDPMDYLHFNIPIPSFLQEKVGAKSIPMGGSIYVHSRHKATTTTSVMGVLLPFRHISSIPGIYFIVNIPGSPHEGEVYWGSTSVLAQGSELSGSDPQQVLTCWCPPMGLKMLPTMPNKIKKNPLSYFAFYNDILSMYVQINTGGPVLVGGTFAPHNYTMAEMLMRFAGMALIKGLGKLAGALSKKALKGVNSLLKKALGDTNPLSKRLCAFGLEPVNFVTGAMFFEWIDFELPGGTTLKWGNIWRSDKPYTGMMGNGVYNSYDLYIIPDAEAGIAGFNHPKENMVMPLPYLEAGSMPYYDRSQRVWMERPDEQTWIITLDQDIYTYLRHAGKDGDIFRIQSIRYAEGTTLTFSYHRGSCLLATIRDNTGRTLELNADDQLTHITQVYYNYKTQRVLMVSYDYDEHNNLVRVTDRAGKALRLEYDSHNRIVRRTNRNGIHYCWTYDAQGRVIHTHGPEGYLEGRLEYFPEEGYNEVQYSDGRVMSYHYDENDLLYKEVDAMGGETYYAYTRFNERRMVASPEGRLVGYDYDEQGNIKTYHTPEGEQHQYAYNHMNQLVMRSEPSGLTETWNYDGQLRKTEQVRKDGRIVKYCYEETSGLLTHCIDDKGQALYWQYNELRQVVSETDETGTGRSWQYDAFGQMAAFRPGPQQELRWQRDTMGRITKFKGHGQDEVTFAYDAYELPVYAADSKEEWQLEYTPMGNLRRQTRRSKANTRHRQLLEFSYDKYEQLQSVTNEKGERHTFSRDANDQVTEETGFDGLLQQYIRDRDGQLLKTVLPEGKSIYHSYDLSGRLVYNRYDDGFWEAFRYDRSGLLESADNPNTSVQLRRNPFGQVIQEVQGGHTIDYTYDAFGNLTGLKSALGADIAMTYDSLGYLTGMEAQQGGEAWTTGMIRNPGGDELNRSMTGGLSSSFVYDHEGRPISQKIAQGSHTHLHHQYTWNNNYKLAACLNLVTGGKINYDYDSRGDLAATTYDHKTLEYKKADDAGNVFRTAQQKDRVYGPNGKLLRDQEWHYRYDALGRLILKSKRNINDMPAGTIPGGSATPQWAWITTDDAGPLEQNTTDLSRLPDAASGLPEWEQGDWLYTWYPDGMLQSVKSPEGGETSFEYDALGRRTAKIGNGHIRRYLWQGNQLLHEWEYDLAERPQLVVDKEGLLTHDHPEPVSADLITWIYEGDQLTPVARLVGGRRWSVVSDYRGVPVMAFDEEGRKVWACTLDGYGCIREQYGAPCFIPFRYPGQYEDEETGLYYNRFRYYDCHTGTYISPDPIGLAGNNPTFYSYTHDPNIFFDPFGLTFQKRLGDYGENWAKQQLSNNGKYKQVFHVQNASNNGIDLVGLRHDGKFDIFEVKTNMSGEVGKLSPRQADPAAFVRDVLGPNKAGNGSYGISPRMANQIKNNIGDYRLIDVWVKRGDKGRWYVDRAMVSDWTEIGKLYQ